MSKSTRKQPAKTSPSAPNAAKRLAMYDRVFEALNKVAAIRREEDPDDREGNTEWTIQYKHVGSGGQGNCFTVETDCSICEFNLANLFDTDSASYEDFIALEMELDDRERTIASLSPEQRRVLGLKPVARS